MSHAENKLKWCLKKAQNELKEKSKHRGLVKIEIDSTLIDAHIKKAEHNLKAILDFKEIGYSDWSASAAFYSIYHSLLAITAKFGYESRNQKCTFAVIYYLIETEKIYIEKKLINQIHQLNPDEQQELPTIVEIREFGQYGIALSLEDDSLNKIVRLSKEVLDRAKEIVEE